MSTRSGIWGPRVLGYPRFWIEGLESEPRRCVAATCNSCRAARKRCLTTCLETAGTHPERWKTRHLGQCLGVVPNKRGASRKNENEKAYSNVLRHDLPHFSHVCVDCRSALLGEEEFVTCSAPAKA
jgi:hypothetical protein